MRNYNDVNVNGDDDSFFESLKEIKTNKCNAPNYLSGKEILDDILKTNTMLSQAFCREDMSDDYKGYIGLTGSLKELHKRNVKPITKRVSKTKIKNTWSDEDEDEKNDDVDIENRVSKSFERGSFMAVEKRENDLILAPNEYVLVSDETSGKVNVIVGPKKESLAGTDQPMRFDGKTQRYIRCSLSEAIQRMPYADERSYIILQNPAANESNPYPKAGTSNSLDTLKVGQSINVKGPTTFALWPGQVADVIPGHQLRSNQYLLIRITNVDHAYGDKEIEKDEVRLATGQLNIIKGTETAFYIPPTGIEVLKDDNDEYVRDALTLERLEYCVLKDESGEKRYVRGPAVVFPKPTETFVERGSGNTKSESGTSRKFKAVELNDNMGLYIKVISDYIDGEGKNAKEIKAGEELFITGKDQKIYFPRPEHAIIKYGQQIIHYAVAVPKGRCSLCIR
jgi:major vault protein